VLEGKCEPESLQGLAAVISLAPALGSLG